LEECELRVGKKAMSARVSGTLIKNSGSTVLIVESDPTSDGSRRDIADGCGLITGVALCAKKEGVPTKSIVRIRTRMITLA